MDIMPPSDITEGGGGNKISLLLVAKEIVKKCYYIDVQFYPCF